jgi:hypothetical protein
LSRFLSSRKLDNLEKELRAEEAYHEALKALPTRLASTLYQKTFENGELKAEIGLSHSRITVGLDKQGRTMGRMGDLGMPVQAIVWGASPVGKRRREAVAELPAKAYLQLNAWAEELCRDWVKERADDRELLLTLLLLSMREIGSRDHRPLAEMAGLLWDLPLFSRVDKTKVSGSALAATFSESKEPVLVSPSTFRVPGSVIAAEEGSEQHQILLNVLGKDGVRWYQAPPLIDTVEVRQSIKRLVTWGFTPFTKTVSAIHRVFKDRKPEEEEGQAKPSEERAQRSGERAKRPEKRAKGSAEESKPTVRDPREVLVVALKEDVCSLLGRELFRKSDQMFKSLDFGNWPLGPPVYRPRGKSHFRLNEMHTGVRWLLIEGGDERHKRAARMMLVVHWVGLVNVASEELRDWHEDEFLVRLAERMTKTFT